LVGAAGAPINTLGGGGTANGVAYLNGSKVLTTGSALTFDGTNLGIGTSSPGAKLEVSSVTDGDTIRISFPSAATGTTGGGLQFRAYTNSAVLVEQGRIQTICTDGTASYAGDMRFMTANAGALSEKMRLNASGNLGIGTSSPGAKLNISGSSNTLLINGSATAANFARFTSTGGDGALGLESSTAGTICTGSSAYATLLYTIGATSLQLGTNSNVRATLDSSGNLLVGTTTQVLSAKQTLSYGSGSNGLAIDCVDNVNATDFTVFRANSAVCGSVSRIGTTSAVAYVTTSDYRAKENIAPMTGALAKVLKLKPITYDWKSGGSSQGFIAHELQAVVPDAVVGEKDAIDADGNPKYQGIDTSFLVATLTAAIQEQQALIQSLTDRVAQLEAK